MKAENILKHYDTASGENAWKESIIMSDLSIKSMVNCVMDEYCNDLDINHFPYLLILFCDEVQTSLCGAMAISPLMFKLELFSFNFDVLFIL